MSGFCPILRRKNDKISKNQKAFCGSRRYGLGRGIRRIRRRVRTYAHVLKRMANRPNPSLARGNLHAQRRGFRQGCPRLRQYGRLRRMPLRQKHGHNPAKPHRPHALARYNRPHRPHRPCNKKIHGRIRFQRRHGNRRTVCRGRQNGVRPRRPQKGGLSVCGLVPKQCRFQLRYPPSPKI